MLHDFALSGVLVPQDHALGEKPHSTVLLLLRNARLCVSVICMVRSAQRGTVFFCLHPPRMLIVDLFVVCVVDMSV